MNNRGISKKTGIALAIAAAGLVAGCGDSPGGGGDSAAGSGHTSTGGSVDLVHCYGVNICGGHNDCKTAGNGCSGQATCKGTGFVGMPAKACADVGGTQKDNWVGQVSKADLVHCYGVNICGGHNDCKTADNACAGQATCKGAGFVTAPAKACADIGGKAKA